MRGTWSVLRGDCVRTFSDEQSASMFRVSSAQLDADGKSVDLNRDTALSS